MHSIFLAQHTVTTYRSDDTRYWLLSLYKFHPKPQNLPKNSTESHINNLHQHRLSSDCIKFHFVYSFKHGNIQAMHSYLLLYLIPNTHL